MTSNPKVKSELNHGWPRKATEKPNGNGKPTTEVTVPTEKAAT
jgi:hypothetical protein